MAEKNPNIVTTTVRIERKLHDDLNDFVHEAGRGLPPKDRPSKDAIIQQAVKSLIYGSSATSDLSDKAHKTFLHVSGRNSDITHEITTKEISWVQKFLRIIRSKTQFKKSIEENVDGFCLGLDALEEVAELRAKLGDSTGSSDQAGDESGDDLAEGIKRARADADRIGRSLEGTGADGKDVRKKKA